MNKKLIIGLLVLVVLALVLSSCKTEGEARRTPRKSPTPSPSPAPTCGDRIINNNEVCDGSNLGGKTCTNLGYNEGTLSCCSNCTKFDLSNCKNITRTCKDYDKGANYYVASNVSFSSSTTYGPSCSGPSPGGGGGGGTVSDTCNSSIILIERICNADNTAGSIKYECPISCSNGACVNLTGTIYATSYPTLTNLYIDNIYKGTTPKTVIVNVGNHLVKFTKVNYDDYITTAYVYAGQTTYVYANLTLINNQTVNST